MTGIIPNTVYSQASGSTSTGPLITQFFDRAPTEFDISDYKVGQRWIDRSNSLTATITGITQANPAVVTAINDFIIGQLVTFSGVGGMTQLNGNTYQVIAVSGTSFTIDVDSTEFGAYTSGGIATATEDHEYILNGFKSAQGFVTADWVLLSSTGAAVGGLDTLTGNTGGPVGADPAGNINVIGSGTLAFNGTPVNNTLTGQISGTFDAPLLGRGLGVDASFSTTVTVDDILAEVFVTGGAGTLPRLWVQETAGLDFAQIVASSASPKTGFFSSGKTAPDLFWNFGMASLLGHAFVINTATGFQEPGGGTIVWTITQTGVINAPLQPTFLAVGAGAANVTGDGTAYTVGSTGTAWTKIFDQGTNFNTNGTFTAPVTGKYKFEGCIEAIDIGVGHTSGFLLLVGTSRTLASAECNPFAVSATGNMQFMFSCLIDLAAGNTFVVQIQVNNSTLTVDVNASSSNTWFSGYLVC